MFEQHGSFFRFLAAQRMLLLAATGLSVLAWFLLIGCFPLPDINLDSNNYVFWAMFNFKIAYRPIGYSVFLQLAHAIGPASWITVLVQYILSTVSTLGLFFVCSYLYGMPSRKWAIIVLLVCNPILIFLANMIGSDSLFLSLTLMWFTACLWTMSKGGWWALLWQAVLLWLCLEVRFTALFYPFLSVAAFLVCRGRWWYKAAGITAIAAVAVWHIHSQIQETEHETGTAVYSGFAGWQVANNAIYAYKYIDLQTNDLPTTETQEIDHLVHTFIDSVPKADSVGFVYIWDSRSPFKKYLNRWAYLHHTDYFTSWFNVSAPLGDYGWYIIHHYPGSFARHFLLPNAVAFFYPPTEGLTNYDYKYSPLTDEVRQWFGIASTHLDCPYPMLEGKIMGGYPALCLVLHIINILSLLRFFVHYRSRNYPAEMWRGVLFWGVFYFIFMAFSIFAAAVNLRFLGILFVPGIVFPFLIWNKQSMQRSDNSTPD